jgi:hypothetical protein
MNFNHLQSSIIDILEDASDNKFLLLANISKAGIHYDDRELSGNYADIVRHIFHSKITNKPLTLTQRNYYRRFVICHKIIIRHNPHLINNKTYVGNGGKTDFVIVLQLLLMSHSEFYYAWRDSPVHADYFDIAYELFMFNKQYIQYLYQEDILCEFSNTVLYKNKYQCEVFKIMFEEFELNPIFDSFYNAKVSKVFDVLTKLETIQREFRIYESSEKIPNLTLEEEQELFLDDLLSRKEIHTGINSLINSPWCKLIFKNDLIKSHNYCKLHETKCGDECKHKITLKLISESTDFDIDSIEKRELFTKIKYLTYIHYNIMSNVELFIKNLYKNMNIDILNQVVKYAWFDQALKIHKEVPENDNNLIKLFEIKKIRKIFVNNSYIFFDIIRRRRTKIIKYLWKYEQSSIKKLRNDKGEDILTYAKSCRGLMHNIIALFSR